MNGRKDTTPALAGKPIARDDLALEVEIEIRRNEQLSRIALTTAEDFFEKADAGPVIPDLAGYLILTDVQAENLVFLVTELEESGRKLRDKFRELMQVSE